MRVIFTRKKVKLQLRPVSAISRMVCLMAQMILSIKSLNWFGGIVNNATGKESECFQGANYQTTNQGNNLG